VTRLNDTLRARAVEGGYDAVLVDKGTLISRSTLLSLKEGASLGIAVHYTPDAAFHDNRSRLFLRALPHYDLLVTTKRFEEAMYRRAGAREILIIEQGFGPRIDPQLGRDVPETLRSEVVFIGHCQPHYARLLEIAARVAPLAIWGPGWPSYARRHRWARGVVRGPGLYGPDYARALGGAKIALGLLSKRIPETTTTRSFEIPAMGTMLLAERTGDHLRLFEDGKEAAFFDDADEMVSHLRRYLADDVLRDRIAAAGQARCRASGYAAGHQLRRIVGWLERFSSTSA
jgi:hypothetical protein